MPNGTAVLLERLSEGELRLLFEGIVQRENGQLRKEIASLPEELRENRAVITPRQETFYFDSRVSPETIIDYIKYEGLPAAKRGECGSSIE